MRRVLITGASGFIGGYVARVLAARQDVAVTAVGGRTAPDVAGASSCRLGDLANPGFVRTLFAEAGFDSVVHAAAQVSKRQDAAVVPDLVRANVLATANLAAAASGCGCQRFVYCSSISVYGSCLGTNAEIDESLAPVPNTPYGWSKLAGEQAAFAAAGAMAVSALRLAGVHGIGRRSGAVYTMLKAAMAGEALTVSEPDSRFRFAFVDDVAAIISRLLELEPPPTGTYNVAGAVALTLREMAEQICTLTRSSSRIEFARDAPRPRSELLCCARLQAAIGFQPAPFATHVLRMAAQERR